MKYLDGVVEGVGVGLAIAAVVLVYYVGPLHTAAWAAVQNAGPQAKAVEAACRRAHTLAEENQRIAGRSNAFQQDREKAKRIAEDLVEATRLCARVDSAK